MQRRQNSVLPSATTICSVLVISVIIPSIFAFNLDTINYVRYEGEADTMFGFSIALHKEQQQSW